MTDDPNMWMAVAEKYGPWVLLVGLSFWWSWVRENRMATRMDKTEDYIRETLRSAIDRNTNALMENARHSGEIVSSLRKRNCLMDHDKGEKKYSNLPKEAPYEQQYYQTNAKQVS